MYYNGAALTATAQAGPSGDEDFEDVAEARQVILLSCTISGAMTVVTPGGGGSKQLVHDGRSAAGVALQISNKTTKSVTINFQMKAGYKGTVEFEGQILGEAPVGLVELGGNLKWAVSPGTAGYTHEDSVTWKCKCAVVDSQGNITYFDSCD